MSELYREEDLQGVITFELDADGDGIALRLATIHRRHSQRFPFVARLYDGPEDSEYESLACRDFYSARREVRRHVERFAPQDEPITEVRK